MDRFIHLHQENTCQQDFWKIANDDSDDEADSEDQIESQTTEALDNLVASQTSSLASNDLALKIQLSTLLNSFLESLKSKKQQKETSWVYNHFHQMILEKTFFNKQTEKIKTDIQYSCLCCKASEKWTTIKSVIKGSTSNLQKHLGQKHGIYKDQDISLDIFIDIYH